MDKTLVSGFFETIRVLAILVIRQYPKNFNLKKNQNKKY
jgi:hypothetical protein